MQTNNYQKRYQKFIKSRPNRSKKTFDGCETHHILPRCMGGKNTSDNLVVLTLREHFIAHLMLSRCFREGTKQRQQMIAATMNFGNRMKISSRMFEKLRLEQGQIQSQRMKQLMNDPSWRKRFVEHRQSKSYKKLMSQIRIIGYQNDPTYKKRISETKTLKTNDVLVLPKYKLRPTWGDHKKNFKDRRLCVRCGVNETHSSGNGLFRPRCHRCDVELGKRKVSIL